MFTLRSFSRSGKRFTNYICTSSVINSKFKNKPSKHQPQQRANKYAVSEKDTFSTSKPLTGKTKKGANLFGQDAPKETPTAFSKFMKNTVDDVAENLGGNVTQTKKELFEHLAQLEVTKEREAPEPLMLEMKGYISGDLKSILGDERLDLFKKKRQQTEQLKLNIWDDLEREDREYKSRLAPRNYFEELIEWTKDGKLWVFPIDNDQGADAEAKVSFTEHIFLDKHLEPWCPKSGPIRKFMNLVLIGLAKNPYITVEEKKEHISWFKTYFENKKKLLQELGALGTVKELEPPDKGDS